MKTIIADNGDRLTIDDAGNMVIERNFRELTADMIAPVHCSYCGDVYDLAACTPTARFADCDVFRTPCCDVTADTREWIGYPAFKRIEK